MKPRIQMDVLIMATGVVLTLGLFLFPQLYSQNRMLDDVLDFLGVLLILKGIFLRMAARGYKKRFSRQSHDLVTAGPYSIVRNPMYLGTYFIGAGFFLILTPWWTVVIYTFVFYRRFLRQILIEEKYLRTSFGERYDQYCQKVPRLIPDLFVGFRITMRETFPWQDAWTTKEKGAILPALAGVILLETLKEKSVFGSTDIMITFWITAAAAVVFSLGLWIRYQER